MKRKKTILLSLICLFVVANLYLIFKKDSEVKRMEYIDEWVAVKGQSLTQSKNKEGVVIPSDVEHVYLSGELQQFLVKEGEKVEAGTPLLEYSSRDTEDAVKGYKAELAKLEIGRDAIQANIEQLEELEAGLSTEKDESNAAMASSVQAQIYEKELQLSQLEGEMAKYEELVANGDERLSSLTVSSSISGVVKEINQDLKNPVMTIVSNEKQLEGALNEKEAQQMEEGMKVFVTSNAFKGKVEGVISEVAAYPSAEPDVDKESRYRFTVMFNEQPETDLLTGSHVLAKIITKEVVDALTLPASVVRDKSAFVLKSNGTIEKREVKTGLHIGKIVEMKSGVELDELVVRDPGKINNDTAFYTPISMKKLEKTTLQQMPKTEILLHLARGILTK